MVSIRVHATKEQIALITEAAGKLGLTPSQFVTRAAIRSRHKQKEHKAERRSYSSRKTPSRRRRKP